MPKWWSFLVGLVLGGLVVGCSKTSDEKVTDAVDTALYHLSQTTPECQKAIDVLEDIGRQANDARYLQALASAYACRGNFSELTLFDEIDTIDSSAFLTSLTELSTSAQTVADSSDFDDLQTAIDILLYAGGVSTPSTATMKTNFGTRQAGNMSLQALYMIIVQLGRYTRWYGNTDSTGVKGSGSLGNTCFFNYGAAALAVATSYGGGNACQAGNTGSPDLDYGTAGTSTAQVRLCKGAMLVNNMLDILNNTTLSSNSSLGDISSLLASITPYIDAAEALDPGMPAFIANLKQSVCETDVAADDSVAQLYFASIFEGGLP